MLLYVQIKKREKSIKQGDKRMKIYLVVCEYMERGDYDHDIQIERVFADEALANKELEFLRNRLKTVTHGQSYEYFIEEHEIEIEK